MVAKRVDELNKALADEPQMAASQIRRFLILHKELDADDGELTRTQKVRRSFIADRYGAADQGALRRLQGVPRRHRGDVRGRPQGHRRGRHAHRRHEDLSVARGRAAEGGRRMKADVEPKTGGAGKAPAAGEVLLSVENVSLSFGGVKALRDVSFDIRKGEIRAIIGPNGAGKTSMLNVINGFYHPQQGIITFKGKRRQRHAALHRRQPGHRPHLPERGAVQGHVDARQHHDRAHAEDAARPAGAGASTGALRSARRSATARRSSASSTSWRSPTSARRRSASCPTACRSASSSAARSPWSPSCCCSTSRWPA